MGDFDLTLGPLLVGTLLNAILLGIVLMQHHEYWITQGKAHSDPRPLKAIVVLLLLIDVAQTVLNMIFAWYYLIEAFDNPIKLASTASVFPPAILLGFTTPYIVHIVYSWRIYRLTQLLPVVLLILATGTTGFIFGVKFSVGVWKSDGLEGLGSLRTDQLVCSSTAMVADVVIAMTLCTYLVSRICRRFMYQASYRVGRWYQRRTGIDRTDNFISKVILFTVQTGVAVTFMSAAVVGTYPTIDKNLVALMLFLPLPKVYSISLLSSLNMRKMWVTGGAHFSSSSANKSSKQRSTTDTGPDIEFGRIRNINSLVRSEGAETYVLNTTSKPDYNGSQNWTPSTTDTHAKHSREFDSGDVYGNAR